MLFVIQNQFKISEGGTWNSHQIPCAYSSWSVKNYLICPIRIELIHGRHRVVPAWNYLLIIFVGHVLWRFTLIHHGKKIWKKVLWHWSVKWAWHPNVFLRTPYFTPMWEYIVIPSACIFDFIIKVKHIILNQ